MQGMGSRNNCLVSINGVTYLSSLSFKDTIFGQRIYICMYIYSDLEINGIPESEILNILFCAKFPQHINMPLCVLAN